MRVRARARARVRSGLRDRRAEHVGDKEVGGPAEVRCVPGEEDLRDYEQERAQVLTPPLVPEELLHLRVRLHDLLAARGVRLIGGVPDEVLARLELLRRLERTRRPGGRAVQLR